MSPSELGEWIADYNIEPWGEWRDDWRAAQHSAMYAEVHRDKSARSEQYSPADFMLDTIVAKRDTEARDLELSNRLRLTLLSIGKRKK